MLMKSEHRKELVSEIRSLAQSQGLNTVFTTFLEITANSLAAQTDPENAEKREQRYQEMASTMTPELLSSYARMLALLFLTVREYRDDPCDILGGIYHELNLNTQAAYIFSALQSELDKAKRRFRKPSLGKHRFSLSDTNEFDNDSPLEPTIALALPGGSYLRAVAYEDDHFPAINIYWDHDGGKASELLCFAEYNSERAEGAQICIGTYVSDEDETQYYAPYMAERNKEP